MKTAKEYSDTAKSEVSVDVDALLKAINEICESEIHRSQMTRSASALTGVITIHGMNWPMRSSLISMTLACRRSIAD